MKKKPPPRYYEVQQSMTGLLGQLKQALQSCSRSPPQYLLHNKKLLHVLAGLKYLGTI